MRVLFFGMDGGFSAVPLAALLAADIAVCGVVAPQPPALRPGPALRPLPPPARRARHVPVLANGPREPHLLQLAWAAGVPVVEVNRLRHPDILAALRDLRPDLICVACFPYLLPRPVLLLPRYGALNLHPSLLPAYRGPAPLFWIFHDGLEHAGVTVHLIDEGTDGGPIVARAPIALPDGIGYGEAEQICADTGARLLQAAVRAVEAGTLAHRPQQGQAGRYAALPTDEDYVIAADWPARRAFNFARGLAGRDRPVILAVGDERLAIDRAVAFSEQTIDEPLVRAGAIAHVRCMPGTLTVRCHDLR